MESRMTGGRFGSGPNVLRPTDTEVPIPKPFLYGNLRPEVRQLFETFIIGFQKPLRTGRDVEGIAYPSPGLASVAGRPGKPWLNVSINAEGVVPSMQIGARVMRYGIPTGFSLML